MPINVGLAKDCSRVVEGCKSHFRGIKPYYPLAIVRSRIFGMGRACQHGEGFPEIPTAIKIKHMELRR
jgi:hypothetical protein